MDCGEKASQGLKADTRVYGPATHAVATTVTVRRTLLHLYTRASANGEGATQDLPAIRLRQQYGNEVGPESKKVSRR